MTKVLRLLWGGELGQRLGADGAGVAGAALIEQQHPKLLQGPLDPAAVGGRTRGAKAGPTLQEQQPGQIVVQPVLATEGAAEQGEVSSSSGRWWSRGTVKKRGSQWMPSST